MEARADPDHIWHDRFPELEQAAVERWDDIARELIKSVPLSLREDDGPTEVTVPLLVSFCVRDPNAERGQQGYIDVPSLKLDRGASRRAVIAAIETAGGHLAKARDTAYALGFSDELAQLIEQVTGLVQRIEEAA